MSAEAVHVYTPEEYLALERAAEIKSEYYGGEVFAMPGASRAHSRIGVNIAGELNAATAAGPCEVYGSDMRVQVTVTGLYTYPDASVACGEPEFGDAHIDTLLNPTYLVEVLSDSTEKYDRGKKAEMYRQLPSLREYLLIAQDRAHVELYTRQADGGWKLTEATGVEGSLRLTSLDCELPLAHVYAKVRFTSEGEPRTAAAR
jgi:Uma2 family endonuclease